MILSILLSNYFQTFFQNINHGPKTHLLTKNIFSIPFRFNLNIFPTMPNVTYTLAKTSRGHTLRLNFYFNGSRFAYYPGEQISPAQWSRAKQRVTSAHPAWREINDGLDRLAAEILRLYREHRGNDPLTPETLRPLVDEYWKGASTVSLSVVQVVTQIQAERVKAGEITKDTAKAVRTLVGQISRFKKASRLSDINLNWLAAFKAFLISEGKAPNTIQSSVKRLKTYLDIAYSRGYCDSTPWKVKGFSAKGERVDNIYLTESEVQAIENLKLSKVEISKARDLFLIGVYTGLRYSDFSKLDPGDFVTHEGVFMARKFNKKTRKVTAVPISEKGRAILEKYGFKMPSMGNAKLNLLIKELGQRAGITEMVKYNETRGAESRPVIKPKWALITTHTARRTYATLGYLRAVAAGVSYEPIKNALGHTTDKQFFDYIKISAEDRAAAWGAAGLG